MDNFHLCHSCRQKYPCIAIILMILIAHQSPQAKTGCNLYECQRLAFDAWGKFEEEHDGVLQIFDFTKSDYFLYPLYRDTFCDLFYSNVKTCLQSQNCDIMDLQYNKSTLNCWAVRSRAKDLGYSGYKYLPKAMIEYWMIHGQPDFYMSLDILEPICTSSWYPTAPMKSWCNVKKSQMRNLTYVHEALIVRAASKENESCIMLYMKMRHIVTFITETCATDDLTEEMLLGYFCPFYQAIVRLHFNVDSCYTGCEYSEELHTKFEAIANFTETPDIDAHLQPTSIQPCPGDEIMESKTKNYCSRRERNVGLGMFLLGLLAISASY